MVDLTRTFFSPWTFWWRWLMRTGSGLDSAPVPWRLDGKLLAVVTSWVAILRMYMTAFWYCCDKWKKYEGKTSLNSTQFFADILISTLLLASVSFRRTLGTLPESKWLDCSQCFRVGDVFKWNTNERQTIKPWNKVILLTFWLLWGSLHENFSRVSPTERHRGEKAFWDTKSSQINLKTSRLSSLLRWPFLINSLGFWTFAKVFFPRME